MNTLVEIPQSVQGMKNRLTSINPLSNGGVNNPISQTEAPTFDDGPNFSFFPCPVRNTRPSKVMTLPEVYELIKNVSYRKQVQELRSITDPDAFSQFKINTTLLK